jgi:hypothetical protein
MIYAKSGRMNKGIYQAQDNDCDYENHPLIPSMPRRGRGGGKKINLIKLFFVLLLFLSSFFCPNVLKAQIFSLADLDKFDSLLVAEEYSNILNLLKEKSKISSVTGEKDKEHFDHIYTTYVNYVKNVIDLARTDSMHLNLLVEQYNKFSKRFNENLVGKRSAEFYKLFQQLILADKKKEALRQYYLADHFKVRYEQNVVDWCRENLQTIKYMINELKYEEAVLILRNIEAKAKIYPMLDTYWEDIDTYRIELTKKVQNSRGKRFVSARTGVARFNWVVELGTIFLKHGDITNSSWLITFPEQNELLTQEYIVPKISSASGVGFSLNVSRYLTTKFKVVSSFEFGRYFHRGVSSDYPLAFEWENEVDFDVTNYALNIYGGYLLRDKIGLRPLMSLGIGMVKSVRDEFTMIARNNTIVKEEEESFLRLLSEVGLEFIPSKDSMFLYRTSLFILYNLKDTQLTSRLNFNLNVMIGMTF